MPEARKDFSYSDEPEPHKARTKMILQSHPEVRELIGRASGSFWLIFFIVLFQINISWLLTGAEWWLALIVAYFVGAFANHTLFVLIHECSHNLIFKNRTLNMLSAILADLPNIVPTAVSFKSYHLKHHSHQGVYEVDADLASRWEAKLIGNSFIGKIFWEIFFPIFQALRPPRLKEIKFGTAWTFVNWIAVFGFDFLIIWFLGWNSFLYFAFSFFFSVGFHPLGARWIQEHFLTAPPQETYSYYGPLNFLALNVGYNNEHHDFPSVPWNKLPNIKEIAPEHYDNLVHHKSWVMLWIKFLFDSRLSLYSRMVRKNRGKYQ